MNVRIQRISRGLLAAIAVASSLLLRISSASAQATYYWDGNDATLGFGTAGGTWAAPTAGTLTSGWSTSSNGTATVNGNSVTTTTADSLNFGANTAGLGLAAGTITVSGTVNAKDITFGSQNGAVTLSGGTINFGSNGTITVGVNTTISSVISGAGTSFTKVGNPVLTLTGLNTYTGATNIGSSTGGVLEVTNIANGGLASGIGASSSAASNLVLAANNQGVLRYIGSTNASTDRNFTIGNTNYSGGFQSSGIGTLTLTSTNAVSYITTGGARFFLLGGTNTGQNTLNAQLVDNGTGALTFSKNDAGTWVLANNSNSYNGTTSLNGGTLSVSKMADYGTVSAIGRGTAGTAIAFGGGTLNYTGSGDDTNRLVQTNSNATILNNGTGALNFTATGNFNLPVSQTLNRALTFGGTNGGTISGAIQNNTGAAPALSITKIGSGTWALAGNNTYTGSTDVNAGTLSLQSGATTIAQTLGGLRSQLAEGTLISNKSGSGNLTTTFSSYTRAAGATGNIVSTGGTNGTDNSVNITGGAQGFIDRGLYFGGSEYAARSAASGFVRALAYGTDPSTVTTDTVTANNHVKLNTTSYSGAGVTLLSLNLQGSGVNWTNTSGTLTTPGIIKSGGGSQSTISGGSVATPSNTELVIRTDTASDSLFISSNLTHGGGALTKSGAGTLTLNGTNTFTGQTHVSAGTLSISANVNLGAQATGATLNLKGGTLQATGTFGLFNGTAGTNNRAVTLFEQSTIEVTGSNALTIAGVISNSTSAGSYLPGFNKTGTGTLVLSGTNTYTGVTNINVGTLTLGNATDTLADTSSVNVNGGTLSIGGNSDTVRAVTLTSGNITGTGGTLTALSYDVRSGSVSAILGGTASSLTKSTNGTVTLSGANTYTGSTSVAGGTLLVNNTSGSGTGSGSVAVSSGGTLGGSGIISGLVSIEAGGFLAPGNSPGQLTVGGLSLNGTSTTTMELGGTTLGSLYDNITITTDSSLTYGGNLTVVNFLSYDMNATSFTYDLFSFTGTTSGNFSNVLVNSVSLSRNGTTWTGSNGGVDYSFSQSTGDLVISVVPEPATIAILASGVSIFGYRLARRRRVS